MRYAHNVARGYDDRAATTRALMCLPAGMMELVPPKIEGAASVPEQRGGRRHVGRDAWRALLEAGWGETTSKTPQLPRDASVGFRDGRSPRAFLFSRGGRVGTRIHRPLALAIGKRRQHSSLLFYRFRVPLSSRFFFAVRAAYRFRCVTVRTKHTYLKAQRRFQDCCAQNKSGYSRIRATDHKKRREAVTNGQGRQGREDL